MPIREGCIFEGNCHIADDLDTGYFSVFRSCFIGSGCGIWSHCVVDPDVIIGNNVRIQSHVYICAGVLIEDDVFIGPGTKFMNDKYPVRYDKSKWQPPVVKKGVVIGGGVVICPGVTIGEGAKIGAGAVVTKDVPPGEVWVGNPAHAIQSVYAAEQPEGCCDDSGTVPCGSCGCSHSDVVVQQLELFGGGA